jgi:hypothetical protein
VAVFQSHDDLRAEAQRFVSCEPAFGDDVIEQFAAAHVLQNQVQVVFGLQHIIQLQDVRVVNELENGHFALHFLPKLWFAVQMLFAHDFECDLKAVVAVRAQLHQTGAAAAQHLTQNERPHHLLLLRLHLSAAATAVGRHFHGGSSEGFAVGSDRVSERELFIIIILTTRGLYAPTNMRENAERERER